MQTTTAIAPPLINGERLDREEFMDRWEALPHLKFAELIGGKVSLRLFPMSKDHSDGGSDSILWLGTYAAATPGCKSSADGTWYMCGDAPQPECHLRILPEYGGQSSTFMRNGKRYGRGAPELIVEVSLATLRYDLSEKKELYRKAGVIEFPCVQPEKGKVTWFRLVDGNYVELKPKGGIHRSVVFPGLWLDAKALLAGDSARLLEVLRQGLETPEHAEFKGKLAARKKK